MLSPHAPRLTTAPSGHGTDSAAPPTWGPPAEHHVDLERERLGSPWRAGAARPHPHTSDTTIIIYSYGHGRAAPQPRLRAYRAPLLDVAQASFRCCFTKQPSSSLINLFNPCHVPERPILNDDRLLGSVTSKRGHRCHVVRILIIIIDSNWAPSQSPP